MNIFQKKTTRVLLYFLIITLRVTKASNNFRIVHANNSKELSKITNNAIDKGFDIVEPKSYVKQYADGTKESCNSVFLSKAPAKSCSIITSVSNVTITSSVEINSSGEVDLIFSLEDRSSLYYKKNNITIDFIKGDGDTVLFYKKITYNTDSSCSPCRKTISFDIKKEKFFKIKYVKINQETTYINWLGFNCGGSTYHKKLVTS